MHSWSTFGARTSHGQLWIHKIHHSSDLREATTFPLIVYFVPLQEAYIQMTFCPGTPILKFPQLGFPRLWGHITLRVDLWLRWGLKQSFSPCRDLSNGLLHTIYTQENRVNSQFFVVGSQTANLTLDFSFGHNLCLRYPNGSCEPILDIYVSIIFQWYKELFNPMGFDPCNYSLKIQESRILTPKVKAPLGVWRFIPSHFPSLPGFFLVRNLTSPCFGRKPKIRVVTCTSNDDQL
jgi:hypothetical protein